jgi:hypothetical protein
MENFRYRVQLLVAVQVRELLCDGSGNAAAQIFFLKARAGWAEKLEVTGKNGGPVTLAAMREAFATEIEAKSVPKQITDESDNAAK